MLQHIKHKNTRSGHDGRPQLARLRFGLCGPNLLVRLNTVQVAGGYLPYRVVLEPVGRRFSLPFQLSQLCLWARHYTPNVSDVCPISVRSSTAYLPLVRVQW